jgi:SAM-dependent methyltransferase
MKLLIAARDPGEAAEVLEQALRACTEDAAATRLDRVRALWRENPQAYTMVKAVIAGVEHEGASESVDAGVAYWREVFDRMARVSGEGSVALYALGNPLLLRDATREVVTRLGEWHLLGPDRRVLEIGCGIGRFVEALAPQVAHAWGIDISPEMIAQARRRCARLPNVTLVVSSGRDLAPFADASVDLILAADVFPYLVQTGPAIVETHLRESARVMAPGGSLVILNYSYRGIPEQDRADLERLAGSSGLLLAGTGTGDFALWDATSFRLIRPG